MVSVFSSVLKILKIRSPQMIPRVIPRYEELEGIKREIFQRTKKELSENYSSRLDKL